MKSILFIIALVPTLSCGHHTPGNQHQKWEEFGSRTLLWRPVDPMNTPIGNRIEQHPEYYEYLENVEIFSIAHQSDSLRVSGFMVAPRAPGKYPVIIFNRGGNREFGKLLVATAVQVMAPLADEGYVVLATNYRGNSGSEGREEFGGADVNDVANLIRSSAEFEKADNSRVGLLGVSRGGMMNFIALRNHPDINIKALVNVGGVSDLEASIEHHPALEEVCEELIPGFSDNRESELKARSAIYWVDELQEDVPLLLMHSTTDDHVLYDQVEVLADSLDVYGVPYQLQSFADDTHGLTNHREMVMKKVLNWFDRYVKNGETFAADEPRLMVS